MRTAILILLAVISSNSFGYGKKDKPMESFYVVLDQKDESVKSNQTILKLSLSVQNVSIYFRVEKDGAWSDWDFLSKSSENRYIDTLFSGNYQLKLTKTNFETVYGTVSLKGGHYLEANVRFFVERQEIIDEALKPAIYIYSDERETFNLKIRPVGQFEFTYPEHGNDGWDVVVEKNELTCDGKQIDYLYWDGGLNSLDFNYNFGFVFKGSETAMFLEEKLVSIGLNDKEIQDFIAFWGPKLYGNQYNYVHFIFDDNYNKEVGEIETSIQAESSLRVYMAYKSIDSPVSTIEQTFKPFERKGLTIIEWGGGEVFNQQVGL